MAQIGQEIVNPRTGQRVRFVETASASAMAVVVPAVQHPGVQKQERTERLVLGGGSNVLLDGQVGQKGFHIRRAVLVSNPGLQP